MLYYKNLYNLIFENYPKQADEIKVLSGYVGPVPMNELKQLPMKSTVIFGLFKENRNRQLHDELIKIHNNQLGIYYPEILSHSKCYVWLKNGTPIKGLVGSANFSSNGLKSDYRETLFEVDDRQVAFLNGYINIILESAKPCTDFNLDDNLFETSLKEKRFKEVEDNYIEGVAELSLLTNKGELGSSSGLNWGMSNTSHVRKNDAYIPIRINDIKLHPELFIPRRELPEGEVAKNNLIDVIEIIWDDGVVMQAKFEGTQIITDLGSQKYPKQISSFPHKDILGLYFRKRLGVDADRMITLDDINAYGRDNIRLSKIEDGVYFADFSKKVV